MKLATVVVCIITFSLSAGSAYGQQVGDAESSCRKFVQAFYDWYVPHLIHGQGNSAYETVLRRKTKLFTSDLHAKLVDDFEASAKNPDEVVGLDFDPFLNSQDPSEKFVVRNVVLKDHTCFASVRGVQSGKWMERVTPQLVMQSESWQFADFHYAESDTAEESSLLSILSNLKKLREVPNK